MSEKSTQDITHAPTWRGELTRQIVGLQMRLERGVTDIKKGHITKFNPDGTARSVPLTPGQRKTRQLELDSLLKLLKVGCSNRSLMHGSHYYHEDPTCVCYKPNISPK